MKYLLIIWFLFIGISSFAQRPSNLPIPNSPTGYMKYGWIRSDSGFIAPNLSDTGLYVPAFPFTTIGRRTISDTSLYFWTGQRWKQVGSGGVIAANNGLSLSGTTVQLGGPLIKNTTITGIDSTLTLSNGTLLVSVDHRVNGAVPPFKVRSTSPLFHEMAEFKADNTTEVHLRTDSAAGYASILFSTGGTLGLTIGKDGVAAHSFIQIKDGNDLWIENAASSPMAAFSDNGNINLSINGVTRKLGIGTTSPSYKVDITNSRTALTSSDRVFNLNDQGTTYNTNAGAITSYLAFLRTSASRSAGANDLTSVGLRIAATGAQVNQALLVDTGDVVVGVVSSTEAIVNIAHAQTVNNGSSTARHEELQVTRSMVISDTVGGSESFSAALAIAHRFRAKASYSIADNLKGSGIEAQINLLRNTAYTGAVVYQGAIAPSNNVTTMPSTIVSRINMSTAQTGGNSVTAQGWWAAFSGVFDMNTGNRIHNAVYYNAGAGQWTDGAIDTLYGLYVNAFPSLATTKYAIKQVGTADTVSIAGITRHSNLTSQTDTTSYKPMAVSANGVVVKMSTWPGGGGALYAVGRNLRIISGSPAIDTLATIDTLISATPSLSDNSTKVATTAWVQGQGYSTGSTTAPGSTGDMPYKGSNGSFTTSPGSFYNIDSTNKRINIGNPSSTTGGINLDSVGVNVWREKYYINGESVIEQNSAANQTDFTTAAANVTTRFFTGGTARVTITNTTTTVATTTMAINSKLTSGGVSVIDWSGTVLSMGSNDAGFNDLALKVAGAEKARLSSGGTFKINSTSTANEVAGRGLYVNRSIGANKDSVNTISSISSQFVLVQDTASGDDQGKFKKIAASNLVTQNIYNTNGTLTSARTLTGAVNPLTFTDITSFNMYSVDFSFAKTDGTAKYTGKVGSAASNQWQLGYFKGGVIGPAIRIDTNNNVIAGATYNTTYPLYATGSAMFAGDGLVSLAGNFYHVRDVSSDGSVFISDNWISIDASGGNVTLTLPAASSLFGGNVGIRYAFKRLDASGNTVTIQRNGTPGTDTIDGASSFTIVGQYTVKELQAISTSVFAIK